MGVAVAVVDKDTDIAVAVLHEDGPRGGVRCVAHPVLVGEAEHARLDAAVPARREGGGEQAHRVEAAAVLERLPLPRPRVAAVLEDDAGACEAVGEGGNSSLGVTRGDQRRYWAYKGIVTGFPDLSPGIKAILIPPVFQIAPFLTKFWRNRGVTASWHTTMF